MSEGQETNRTEQATPYKLKQAREKGMIARGMDLGFVAGLIGLAAFIIVAGPKLLLVLGIEMRRALISGVSSAGNPSAASALAAKSLWPVLQPVALFGGTIISVVLLVEIVQLRGLSFSAQPLKPDFSRINPAKGLKRLFSMKMLKEAFKSIFKMLVYAIVAWLAIRAALAGAGSRITDAAKLAEALDNAAMRLILLFILAASFFAVIDQILSRGEFAKQMRMSKREVTREHKEREGDPRIKSKRKQLHAGFSKQSKALGNLPGSDMLIVNPRHVAIALSYVTGVNSAPLVTAKGRDRHALQLKAEAVRLGIPIFASPKLARALFKECEMGREVSSTHFHAVAELYFKLRETANA